MNRDALAYLGITDLAELHCNLAVPELVEHALRRGEGILTATGALAAYTGKYTGHSPNDRYIVDDPVVREEIDWGKVNTPFCPERFDALYKKLAASFAGKAAFVCDGFVGAEMESRLRIRVVNTLSYHNLFAKQILGAQTKRNWPTLSQTLRSSPRQSLRLSRARTAPIPQHLSLSASRGA